MNGHMGVDPESLQRTTTEVANAYQRSSLQAGDIVVSIGPSFGKTMLVPPQLEGANLTQGTARVAIRVGVSTRYVLWCLQAKTSVGHWESSVGGATFRALNLGPLAETPIPTPPFELQERIADYLDHETADIDAFIADLLKLSEIMQERRLSEWSELYRTATDATSTQVRHVVSSLVDGPFGSALASDHYADSGAPVVRLGNIGQFEFRIEPRVFVPMDYAARLSSHDVRPGDVVIAGLGDMNHPLGRSAVVPDEFGEGIVKADCYRARVNDRVAACYLAWALSAPQSADSFRELSRGSTRSRLNLGVVAASRIPVPALDTQHRLVETFRRASGSAASAVADIDAAIALAKERRAALITAAVTGQIDVTARQKPVVDSIQRSLAEVR